MKKISLIYFTFLISFGVSAQKISFTLPDDANKEYTFSLNRGISQDVVQKGILSFSGDAVIHIPEKDKGYIGMGTMKIEGNPVLNIIITEKDFSVGQDSDKKFRFKDSPDNDYLYSIMQDRITPVEDTTLYASHFVNLIRYMQQLNKVMQNFDLNAKAKARLYALYDLDMDRLYTSSIWYNVVDGLVRLNGDQQAMGEDMNRILARIKSEEVFEHFVDNLITITGQYGWDDAIDIIIPYVQETGRIEVPRGNIFTAFAMAKVRKGMPAPDIKGLTPSLKDSGASKTLLVFYQPDCDNCHKELEELIKNYTKLNQMGVRIVSISSDHQREAFEKDKKWFPWPDSDKLCDFEGFAGANFLNYGIMATPMFYLLGNDQKVIKRYALVSDIEFSSDNK